MDEMLDISDVLGNPVLSIAFRLVRKLLADLPEPDYETYFLLAYQDEDIKFMVETTSTRAANAIAEEIAPVIAIKIRAIEERKIKQIEG